MSHVKSFLGIEDVPKGWRTGNYQNENTFDRRGLHEYIDRGDCRAAVFHSFRKCPGWGVYVLSHSYVDYDWELFGDTVSTHEEAVHLMVAYAQLGAFDAYV